MNNQDIINQTIMDSHPRYKLVYDKTDSWFPYKIYEYELMLDSNNNKNIYTKIITCSDKQEDAIKYFLDLTNKNQYTIMSSGRIG